MLKEYLARNLKSMRRKNDWTQEVAAELCGLSPRFWGKIERGKASASVDTLEKITSGLNIGIDELFAGEEGDVGGEE